MKIILNINWKQQIKIIVYLLIVLLVNVKYVSKDMLNKGIVVEIFNVIIYFKTVNHVKMIYALLAKVVLC